MSERSGKIQTVLGLIEPSELGHTQPHEHLLVNLLPPPLRNRPGKPIRLERLGHLRRNWADNVDNLRLTSEETAIEEMQAYKAAGGGALVDQSCHNFDLGRSPEGLVRIAREAGIHVIMGSGFYIASNHSPEVENLSEEDLAARICSDILDGVDGSGIKSGIIGEMGLSSPVEPNEEKALRAAVLAQKQTGAGLSIHPGRDSVSPMEGIHIVRKAGGDWERTVICHIDRTLFSLKEMLNLAETGCYLEFDLFGEESSYYPLAPIDMPNDATRIDYIMQLMKAGYADRILISQDICTKHRLTKFGGEGYSHILQNVLPMMRRKGMNEDDIQNIVVKNPAGILSFVR
ncbi:MAG: aryldialkylphosphatase [Deltaproteobacteria bacterium]|nr:aryldialkylphosphatase [Deltaproteobacteria bacterium]